MKEAKKNNIEENNQAIYNFLLDRVKANLHIIVCMSPVGEPFRYKNMKNNEYLIIFNKIFSK